MAVRCGRGDAASADALKAQDGPHQTCLHHAHARSVARPFRCFETGQTSDKVPVACCTADHVMGLVPLLCTICDGAMSSQFAAGPSNAPPPLLEIYGPYRLRSFVRQTLSHVYVTLDRPYAVHELRLPSEANERTPGEPLENEHTGRDIQFDSEVQGWKNVLGEQAKEAYTVSAGPIAHRVPCIGYVVREQPRPLQLDAKAAMAMLDRNTEALREANGAKFNPRSLLSKLTRERRPIKLPNGEQLLPPAMESDDAPRTVTILGDTSDALGLGGFVASESRSADMVVHESTNAFLPLLDASQASLTRAEVEEKARDHGHSTPEVAARFAHHVGARGSLVLNHLSARYPAPALALNSAKRTKEQDVIDAIRDAALAEWRALQGSDDVGDVLVAHDFFEVEVPRYDKRRKASSV